MGTALTTFVGRFEGAFSWGVPERLRTGTSTLVSALVGALVDSLVGPLVGRLVDQVSYTRAVPEAQGDDILRFWE